MITALKWTGEVVSARWRLERHCPDCLLVALAWLVVLASTTNFQPITSTLSNCLQFLRVPWSSSSPRLPRLYVDISPTTSATRGLPSTEEQLLIASRPHPPPHAIPAPQPKANTYIAPK